MVFATDFCPISLKDGYPAASAPAAPASVIVAEAPDANILKTRTYDAGVRQSDSDREERARDSKHL